MKMFFKGSITAIASMAATPTFAQLVHNGNGTVTVSSAGTRVSGFAFGTTPDVTGDTASGIFINLLLDGNYPNGVGAVGVSLQNRGNARARGGNGGVR